jgi:tetratricopeptide (TPR) repeat protein
MSSHSGEQLSALQQYAYDVSLRLKEEGNKLHGQKKYAKAADKYMLAAGSLEEHPVVDLPPKLKELHTICRANLASCYLQLGRWQECEEACNAVLLANPANCKALYRRGQALLALGKYSEAVTDLKVALMTSPVSDQPPIQEKLEEAMLKERFSVEGSDDLSQQAEEMYRHIERGTSRQRSLAHALEERAATLEETERTIRAENLPGPNMLKMNSSQLRKTAKMLRKQAAQLEVQMSRGRAAPILSDGVAMHPSEMRDMAKLMMERADETDKLPKEIADLLISRSPAELRQDAKQNRDLAEATEMALLLQAGIPSGIQVGDTHLRAGTLTSSIMASRVSLSIGH